MRSGMKGEIAGILRGLKDIGITQDVVATELGLEQSTISRWAKGSDPQRSNYEKLMKFAREKGVLSRRKIDSRHGAATVDEREIPLSGYVGAGATVIRLKHDTSTEVIERIEVPAAFGDVEAYKVRGDSMYPAYRDGDILCVEPYDDSPDQLIGKECLVITTKDEWLIKQLERGTRPGRYHLISHNAEPKRDVEIIQASPIRFVIKG